MRSLIPFITAVSTLIVFFGVFGSAVFAAPIIAPEMTVTKYMQAEQGTESATDEQEKLFSSEDVLSGKKAFLLSLALPGAGEFYSKSYIKSGAFLAIEAAVWSGFFYYMHQYSVKEDEFMQYADEHWYESYWREWYDSLCYIVDTSGADTIELGIEILPDTKTQQFYEMIGKYDWFVLGWNDIIFERDDYPEYLAATYELAITNQNNPTELHEQIVAWLGEHVHSGNMDHYMTMRSDANDQYTIAKYFIGAAIVNHVLSAFDAAWTTKRYNDKLYKGFTGIQSIELRPGVVMRNQKPMPVIECTIMW